MKTRTKVVCGAILALLVVGGLTALALSSRDYRVYWTAANGTVIGGITSAGRLDTLAGAIHGGDVEITGDLDVTGALTTGSGIVWTPPLVLEGALSASGNVGFGTSYNKVTIASATGNTLIAGTLGVTGLTTLTGGLTVPTGAAVTLAGNTTLTVGTGTVTLGGALTVTGAATLSSTLGVTGDLDVGQTASRTFTVTAASGNTSISGTLDVDGAATLTSTLAVTGAITSGVNGATGTAGGLTINNGANPGAAVFTVAGATGNVMADGATISLDGSTSVKAISAALVGLEAPDIRLGINATEYMKIAVTATTGAVAITHTGNAPAVTWTNASGITIAGALEVTGTLTASGGLTWTSPFLVDGSITAGELNGNDGSLTVIEATGGTTTFSVDGATGNVETAGDIELLGAISIGTYIVLGTSLSPQTPSAGLMVLWFDGTDLKAMNEAGETVNITNGTWNGE